MHQKAGLHFPLAPRSIGAVFLHDRAGQVIWVSEGLCGLLGHPRERLLSMTLADISADFDLAQAQSDWAAIAPGRAHIGQWQQRRDDGSHAVFLERRDVIQIDGGHYYLVTLDHLVAASLSPTQEARLDPGLRQALDTAEVGVWEWDLCTNRIVWSEQIFRLYGLDPRATSPSIEGWLEAVQEEDRPHALAAVRRAIEVHGELTLEWRVQGVAPAERWLLARGQPEFDAAGLPSAYRGIVVDITARKLSERGRIESERIYRTVYLACPDAIALSRPEDGRYFDVNESFIRMFGWTRDEIIGRTALELGIWRDLEDRQRFLALLNSQSGCRNFETHFLTREREVIVASVSCQTIVLQGEHLLLSVTRDISARKRIEAELIESHERLQILIDRAPAALAMFDREMRYVAVSRRWALDYGLDAGTLVGRGHYEVLPEIPGHWRAIYARALQGEVISSAEDRFDRLDGSCQWLKWEVRPWQQADHSIAGIVVFSEDITAQKRVELALQASNERFARLFGASPVPSVVSNLDTGSILEPNQAYLDLFGYQRNEIVGRSALTAAAGSAIAAGDATLLELCREGGFQDYEVDFFRRDGESRVALVSGVEIDLGSERSALLTIVDITERKAAERQIQHLAYFDPLTGLPNRRLFQDRMAQMMAASARSRQFNAVVFLDVDNFKALNDSRGHSVGDQLLIEVARRIQECVRTSDTVARLGGDEFMVILDSLGTDTRDAAVLAGAIAEKLREALVLPYDLDGQHFHCSASLGVSLIRGADESVESVLKHADLAMYEAKSAGRNAVRFFDQAMQTVLDARTAAERDLRSAAALGQLTLYYQPQTDGAGVTHGAEALLRWRCPKRGLVQPMDFIPLAEATGLIVPIGRWVIEAACAQLAAWAESATTRGLHLAVNVSARQFREPRFTATVRNALSLSGADPGRLKLEITESMVIDDVGATLATMQELCEQGVRFSVDDFGTGHSSLTYLSNLPLSELKIDKSFVAKLPASRSDAIIAQTIITLATRMGLEVIAEGVETPAQLEFLHENGCQVYQGHLFGPALPPAEFQAWMEGAAV